MLDVILLVPGVPVLLLALLLVLGRFEAVVAPDAPDVGHSPTSRAREPSLVRPVAADDAGAGQGADGARGREGVAAALGEEAEHSRAA